MGEMAIFMGTCISKPSFSTALGGFLKWGYLQSSSILDWDFPLETIYFGVPPFMETPKLPEIGGIPTIPEWVVYVIALTTLLI